MGESTSYAYYLPLTLGNAITSWKGVGRPWETPYRVADLSALNLSWHYNWWHTAGLFEDPIFVPMVSCVDYDNYAADIQALAGQYHGRVWLVYNEPDMPALCVNGTCTYIACAQKVCETAVPGLPGAACTWPYTPTPTSTPFGGTITPIPTPTFLPGLTRAMARQAAERYAEIYTLIKETDPRAQVFCCGQYYATGEVTAWWDAFLERVEELRDGGQYPNLDIDGVTIHAYPWTDCTECRGWVGGWWSCMQPKLTRYWNQVHQYAATWATPTYYELTLDKPLWITEIGYLGQPDWQLYGWVIPPTEQELRDRFMEELVNWFESPDNPGYDAIAWFATRWISDPELEKTYLYQGNLTTLKPLGVRWASYGTPTPGP